MNHLKPKQQARLMLRRQWEEEILERDSGERLCVIKGAEQQHQMPQVLAMRDLTSRWESSSLPSFLRNH